MATGHPHTKAEVEIFKEAALTAKKEGKTMAAKGRELHRNNVFPHLTQNQIIHAIHNHNPHVKSWGSRVENIKTSSNVSGEIIERLLELQQRALNERYEQGCKDGMKKALEILRSEINGNQ